MNKVVRRLSAISFIALISAMPAQAQIYSAQDMEVLTIRGPSESGSFLAGQLALYELSTSEAARFLDDAARGDWDNPVLVARALEAEAANGNIEDAAIVAEHVKDLDVTSELAHMVLATQALKEQRYGAVTDNIQAISQQTFTGLTANIVGAWALVGQGKLDEAQKSLDRLNELGLEQFLLFHRALMADVAGDETTAIDYFRQAFEAGPQIPRYVEGYARSLATAGRTQEALDVIGRYEASGLRHAVIDRIKEQIEAGQPLDKIAADPQAGVAEMYHAIAIELARDRRADTAVIYLRLALYLKPNAELIALDLAQMFEEAGRHEAANAIYDGVPGESPLHGTAVVRAASNLNAMGNKDAAIARLQSVAESEPDNLDALAALGDLLRSSERYDESIAAYSEVIDQIDQNRPSNWFYYYLRAIAYERSKQWPLAEADFLKSLELSPDQPRVLNYLGYSWVDMGMNLERALGMIERAVAAQPNNGSIVDSLGWAYYRLERYEEAVAVLEQAVRIEPQSAEINDHLGDAYWQVGRKREARFQWNIASYVDEEAGLIKARASEKLLKGLTEEIKNESASLN